MADELTFEQYLEEQLKDPEFRKAWEESEPAYQLKRLRILKKLSQTELAKKVGTRQPSIARLESGYGINNLNFLRRVAEALDAEVEIRLKPKTSVSRSQKAVTYPRPKRPRKKKVVA
jgi:transcriptional regulator with XRE-family HTH domain